MVLTRFYVIYKSYMKCDIIFEYVLLEVVQYFLSISEWSVTDICQVYT